jgi:hypothetical protein
VLPRVAEVVEVAVVVEVAEDVAVFSELLVVVVCAMSPG